MKDDGQSSGLFGNYTWWQLGRRSAKNAQLQQDAIAKLTGRAPVPVRDYNHSLHIVEQWRAEYQRLQQVNAGLHAQLDAAKAHEAELRAWGNRCVADRDRWKDIAEERRQQTLMMGARADRFEDEANRLKGIT